MKKARIYASILLAVTLLLVSVIPVWAMDHTVSRDTNRSKLSEQLLEMVSNQNEDILPVVIFLKSCDITPAFKRLQDKYGYDTDAYEDYNRYNADIVPNILVNGKTITELLNGEKFSRKMISLDYDKSPLDISTRRKINKALVDDANTYLKRYRNEVSAIISKYNDTFVKESKKYMESITLQSKCVEVIIADVKKENIFALADNRMVEDIDYFENLEYTSESWNAVPLTESDSVEGLGSSAYNGGSGYDGSGITIGIIEPECARYDSDNYNLTEADITYINNDAVIQTIEVKSHPTHVASLICGKKTNINGKVYEGAAKGATIYQTPTYREIDFENALEMFAGLGVNVINFSGGNHTGGGYTDIEKYVDRFVFLNRISVVVAAGNDGNLGSLPTSFVSSPAKAFNVITVGNLWTKDEPEDDDEYVNEEYNTALDAPYSVHYTSSKRGLSYMANKPDVVAPGTTIFLPVSSNEVEGIGYGTSYSAPIVTAMVAQLMQYDEFSILNPNCAKNHIICGASNNDITGTTILYTGALTNESGAGLVNAIDTFDSVISENRYYGAYLYTYAVPGEYSTKVELSLKKKQHLRAVVTWMKEEDIKLTSTYGNDIDMRLVRTSQYSTFHVASTSVNNNVEVIDSYIDSSGTYWLQSRLTRSILEQGGNSDLHYWISWRIY